MNKLFKDKKNLIPYIILSTAVLFASTGIGVCSFIIKTNKDNIKFNKANAEPVCYIKSDPNTKYTSVVKAIEQANKNSSGEAKEVVIDPGKKNVVIDENVTINKGTKLYIPYIDLDKDEHQFDLAHGDCISSSRYMNAWNKSKTKVTIEKNKKLTNKGDVYVGGQVASKTGSNCSGFTTEKNSSIVLNQGSKIINDGGTFFLKGFITKNRADTNFDANNEFRAFENINGGTLECPFFLREWHGGSHTYVCIKSYTPFHRFTLENIRNLVYYNDSTSSVVSSANVAASNWKFWEKEDIVNYNAQLSVVSPNKNDNSLISMTSNDSYFNYYYDTNSESATIDIYGDSAINNLSLELAGKSASTKGLFFPMTYHQKVKFHSPDDKSISNVNCEGLKFKFFRGSSLLIDKGVKFCCDALTNEEKFNDKGGTPPYYNTDNPEANTFDPAIFTINGELQANQLGGLFESGVENAIIICNEAGGFKTTELISYKGASLAASVDEEFSEIHHFKVKNKNVPESEWVTKDGTNINLISNENLIFEENSSRLKINRKKSVDSINHELKTDEKSHLRLSIENARSKILGATITTNSLGIKVEKSC